MVPPPANASHETGLLAVQLHPVLVVIVSDPLPPATGRLRAPGATTNVQVVAPAWLTVKLCPAIVSVADRDPVPVLAAAVNPTDPLPLPLAPVIVIHDDDSLAVQVHPAATVTVTVPDSPVASTDWLDGEIDGAQETPA